MTFEGTVPIREVLQDENPAGPIVVPVDITTPVRTQELPSKLAGLMTRTLTTTPICILRHDPRRKRVTLLSFDQDIIIGTSKAQADPTTGSGARWLVNVPLPYDCEDELWIASNTSTTSLTVVAEAWA